MLNKYELAKDYSITIMGRTLHRIHALKSFGNVKKGDLGGWVESEENLSQEGECWIYDLTMLVSVIVYEYMAMPRYLERHSYLDLRKCTVMLKFLMLQ